MRRDGPRSSLHTQIACSCTYLWTNIQVKWTPYIHLNYEIMPFNLFTRCTIIRCTKNLNSYFHITLNTYLWQIIIFSKLVSYPIVIRKVSDILVKMCPSSCTWTGLLQIASDLNQKYIGWCRDWSDMS